MPDTEQEARALFAVATQDVPPGIDLLRGVRARRAAHRVHLRAGFAAAATALAVTGTALTLTLAPAPSALAQLTSAVSRTAGQSYHFSATTRVLPTGSGNSVTDRSDVYGAFDPATSAGQETFSTGTQIRYVGGYVYLHPGPIAGSQGKIPGGKSWLRAPSSPLPLSMTGSRQFRLFMGMLSVVQMSPQTLFSLLKSASDVTRQGSVSGAGWTGTRYTFSVSIVLGPAGSGVSVAAAAGTVDVDQQGRVRRLDTVYTLRVTGLPQPSRVTTDMTFGDFGAPVPVSAPPARDVFSNQG